MIKALALVAALSLTGCATVSMVSKEAVVESQSAAVETSELTKSAKAFTKTAETEGWAAEQRGLMDFASKLFSSGDSKSASNASSYAERVSASDAEPGQVFSRVSVDAKAAASAFADVQTLADAALTAGTVRRADLMSFEGALVAAQTSRRNFAEATGIAAGRSEEADGLEAAETALADLAARIDTARETADALADAYAAGSELEAAAS